MEIRSPFEDVLRRLTTDTAKDDILPIRALGKMRRPELTGSAAPVFLIGSGCVTLFAALHRSGMDRAFRLRPGRGYSATRVRPRPNSRAGSQSAGLPYSSPGRSERISPKRLRARLTRLFMVPTAQLQMFAASS